MFRVVFLKKGKNADSVQTCGFSPGGPNGHFPYSCLPSRIRIVDFAGLDPFSLLQLFNVGDFGFVRRRFHVEISNIGPLGTESVEKRFNGGGWFDRNN